MSRGTCLCLLKPHFHTVHNHDDHGDDDDRTNDVDDEDEVSHSRQGGWDGAKSAVPAAPTHAPLSTSCTTLPSRPLYSYI